MGAQRAMAERGAASGFPMGVVRFGALPYDQFRSLTLRVMDELDVRSLDPSPIS